MAQGVLDQIDQHLGQQLRIAVNGGGRLDRQGQRLLLIFRRRREGVGDRLGQDRELAGPERGSPGAALNLGDAQQRREGVENRVQIGQRALERQPSILGRRQPGFELLAQSGQRRAHVMGDIVGDLLQALHQGRDPIQHPIEGQRQAVEVVIGASDRHTARQVTADDRLRGAGDGRQPPVDIAAQREAAQDAQDDDSDERQAEAAHHRTVQCLDPLLFVSDQQLMAIRQGGREDPDRLALAAVAAAKH